jgi:spiro-SPASM protein
MEIAAILIDDKKIPAGRNADLFLEKTVSKIRNFTNEIFYFSREGNSKAPDGLKPLSFQTSAQFLDFLSTSLSGKSSLILNAYSPLLDVESTKKMLSEHLQYVFDYTYPENLPMGLLPEIIENDVCKFLRQTIPEKMPFFNQSIKELFEKDLSSYDCNLFISESRLIQHRVDFIPNNFNNFLVIEDIITHFGDQFGILELEELIKNNPEILFKRPTFYEIEWNTERESGAFYLGERLTRSGEMKTEHFQAILDQITQFSYNPVVSIGLFGEPFLYPHLEEALSIIQAHPEISFLLESRCLFHDTAGIEKALELPNMKVIFDISFIKQGHFAEFKKPLNSLLPFESLAVIEERIKKLPHPDKIYLQFTRTTQNEDELMPFYERWRDFSDRIIVKKPDTFSGELDACRTVDLSPIRRFPCLHLKHDMAIFLDGNVPLCREDYNGKYKSGNALSEGLEKCWAKSLEPYLSHWKNDFKEPPLCEKCDEWWVFNF